GVRQRRAVDDQPAGQLRRPAEIKRLSPSVCRLDRVSRDSPRSPRIAPLHVAELVGQMSHFVIAVAISGGAGEAARVVAERGGAPIPVPKTYRNVLFRLAEFIVDVTMHR